MLENLSETDRLPTIMQRITDALSAPFVFSPELVLFVNASIGVAVYPDGSDLMWAADQAVYRAKGNKSDTPAPLQHFQGVTRQA